MAVVTVRARGPRSADSAWERYADPASWARWAPQISRVSASAARMATGVTGRVHGPLGVSVGFVVEAWDDAARRWTWTARLGPLRLRMTHGVGVRGTGCEAWLRIRGPLPLVTGYVPVARLALHRLTH